VLRSRIEALGVQVHTSCNTVKITDGASAYHRMVLPTAAGWKPT
jgi:nitrite reductase (NADH) large subunit